MKFTWALLGLSLMAIAVTAYPSEYKGSFSEQEPEVVSHTWNAVKEFFRPVINWFGRELPDKTPKDLANEVKDTVSQTVDDVKDWADDSNIVQTAVQAFKPVHQWFKDTANTLQNKSFKDMYDDTRETFSSVDESVGDWIRRNTRQ